MKILNKLADLPCNSVVGLFGAGEGGCNFLNLLKKFRPDVGVIGFIDNCYSGTKRGEAVFGLHEFMERCDENVWVLVTSQYWEQMINDLQHYGHDSYIVIPNRFLVTNAIKKIESECSIEPVNNSLETNWYTDSHRQKWQKELKQTESLLKEPEDREIFRLLTGNCPSSVSYTNALCSYYYKRSLLGQYRDYIQYQKIKTIFEGGVFDGESTLQFLKDAGDNTVIYGFEPNFKNYLEGKYYSQLTGLTNVEILPIGLWSEKCRLSFIDDGCGTRIVNSDNAHSNNLDKSVFDVTTIDEFVENRSLKSVDFIKLDVEGAEIEALKGAEKTLYSCRPQLAVCIYHSRSHLFQIPLLLGQMLKNYVYRIGHYSQDFKETVWYAIPAELF